MFYNTVLKNCCNFAFEFFMVLDFKVNARLVVGTTINFFLLTIDVRFRKITKNCVYDFA